MATRELEAVVGERDGAAVIELRGEVNARAEAALEEAQTSAFAGGRKALVLDFAGAEYINSTGIALIVQLLARARAQDVKVKATGLSDHYREIFEITRLADFMEISDEGSQGG